MARTNYSDKTERKDGKMAAHLGFGLAIRIREEK
jgi:hypothetical protein